MALTARASVPVCGAIFTWSRSLAGSVLSGVNLDSAGERPMRAPGLQSILIPSAEAEPIVAPFRRAGDWSSNHGVPAHLTVAGPWPLAVDLPLSALTDSCEAMLGERYVLDSVGMLGDAICLFAEDDAPLLRWRARILEIVGAPDRVDESWRIHLTVCRGLTQVAARDVRTAITRALPIACTVNELLLARMENDSLVTLRPMGPE